MHMSMPAWISDLLSRLPSEIASVTHLHLAVFSEPFLTHVLEGKKTKESRFSKHRIVPYEHVREGDVVLMKATGGPVVAAYRVGRVSFYMLDQGVLEVIRARDGAGLCVDSEIFWKSKAKSARATVMEITDVKRLEPIMCTKQDRRGWVVLK